jgi:hypothetical protein
MATSATPTPNEKQCPMCGQAMEEELAQQVKQSISNRMSAASKARKTFGTPWKRKCTCDRPDCKTCRSYHMLRAFTAARAGRLSEAEKELSLAGGYKRKPKALAGK